jgi:hypothetical protein
MKCICCEMHAYETYVCEIHACERHVHKSAGVHLIGVCLRGVDFSICVAGKVPRGTLTRTYHVMAILVLEF